jgi:hypothetical protein
MVDDNPLDIFFYDDELYRFFNLYFAFRGEEGNEIFSAPSDHPGSFRHYTFGNFMVLIQHI